MVAALEPHLHQALLRGEIGPLGIQRQQEIVDAGAIARIGQRVIVGRRILLRLAGAQLVAGGALPGERIADLAECGLDRLLVAGEAASRWAWVRRTLAPPAPALKIGIVGIGRRVPAEARRLNRPPSELLASPSRPVSEMRGKQGGPGGADFGIGGAQLIFGLHHVGPAQQDQRTDARRQRTTVGAACSIDAGSSVGSTGAPSSSCNRLTSWASAVRCCATLASAP